MPYPTATEKDVTSFWEHGFMVVRDAIDPVDLETLIVHCDEILEKKDTMAFDWAWEKGTPREKREFKIVHHHDGQSVLAPSRQSGADMDAVLDVQAGGRFVGQQQRRIDRQDGGQQGSGPFAS